jgi:hypothetical protein
MSSLVKVKARANGDEDAEDHDLHSSGSAVIWDRGDGWGYRRLEERETSCGSSRKYENL